jgi:hypothetical protein
VLKESENSGFRNKGPAKGTQKQNQDFFQNWPKDLD